jgi:hypothetical protein
VQIGIQIVAPRGAATASKTVMPSNFRMKESAVPEATTRRQSGAGDDWAPGTRHNRVDGTVPLIAVASTAMDGPT